MPDKIHILKPAITNSMLLRALSYLVFQESTKRAGLAGENNEILEDSFLATGRQQGYVTCLKHLIGSPSSRAFEKAIDSESTLFDIVDNIVREKVYPKIDEIHQWSEDDIKRFVNRSVHEYVTLHPKETMDAARFI